MRGGICNVIKRCSKANNEFSSDYDPTKEKVDMQCMILYHMKD